ncbi:putative inner membrane transporter YedA [Flavobacterium sp. ACN2]|jgi:drug/metabolite transporter (DMT)-like permease|uniref:DMT family transporter n=1 Tax=unclassified Flavobacterium TaxID=196869 RepID=UPI000BB2F8D1|nr:MULTISPECIES: EamA family transporter [unclassified Flavobacterium]MDY0986983.1 EamA family transporter [Flavobacterium sp. CFBP9031]PBI91502.1 putative inner membrane transporter YedA [Flavobacterium sp. ACN2]
MKQSLDYKLIFALAAVGIIWGTTFLGIRVAVETIPPWFVTSIRQGLAGIIMMIILLFKKELKWIGWENLKHQLVPSILMIVIANGFTTVAEQTVPSGLASVISAMSPILIFLGSILFKLQKPSLRGFIGVIIGFSGVVFIFKDGLGSFLDADYRIGMMFMGFAITAWAGGTIYTKLHGNKSKNIVLNLFYQFTMASCIQIVLAFIFSPTIDVNLWSSKSILAALYLSIFGSVIAFFSYNYALKHVTPVQVSILAYINTIIAVFFGWLILDEKITIDFIIATILIILGVFIINYKKKEKKVL